ncbi:MAG: Holliday junction resolvase RuvX [Alphaproteobacteria bacterium]|nr:Holliday junction resolvase RuvX [Alphaproteobacteria bacterium]
MPYRARSWHCGNAAILVRNVRIQVAGLAREAGPDHTRFCPIPRRRPRGHDRQSRRHRRALQRLPARPLAGGWHLADPGAKTGFSADSQSAARVLDLLQPALGGVDRRLAPAPGVRPRSRLGAAIHAGRGRPRHRAHARRSDPRADRPVALRDCREPARTGARPHRLDTGRRPAGRADQCAAVHRRASAGHPRAPPRCRPRPLYRAHRLDRSRGRLAGRGLAFPDRLHLSRTAGRRSANGLRLQLGTRARRAGTPRRRPFFLPVRPRTRGRADRPHAGGKAALTAAPVTLGELKATLKPGSRLFGLDIGTKTIGIAISDPLLTVASPLETIRRGKKFAADAATLLELAAARQVGGLVLGLPVNMDGTEGPRCQSVRQFQRNLAAKTDLPMAFWDERMSTAAVTRAMIDADLTRAQRDRLVDKLAAAYILQGALDALAHAAVRPGPAA